MGNLVSIVLPVYNGQAYLKEALDSIIKQSYQNWELIIINDCSSDDSLDIATDYANSDKRIRVYTNEVNLLLPKSLNLGFEYAKGKYFTWTSDDNIYKGNALQKMVDVLDKDAQVGFVFANQDSIDGNGALIKKSNRTRHIGELASMSMCGACFMYRGDVAKGIGGYNDALFCAEDYEYFCKLALATKVYHLKESLYQYRAHSASLSATKRDLAMLNMNKVRANFSDKLLEKYPLPYLKKQYTYYKLFKYTKDTKWACRAVLVNPFNIFRILIVFAKNS